MPNQKGLLIEKITAAVPGDLRPYAAIIMPVLQDMIDEQGWDPVRKFLFAYKGHNRSWDRKLQRSMTYKQILQWRQISSNRRIVELKRYKDTRLQVTEMRRQLVQRVMTAAIEIAIGAL